MTQLIIFVMIAVILVVVVSSINNSRGSRRNRQASGRGYAGRTNVFAPWPNAEPPAALGVPQGHPARSAAERLESALGLDFESRVKDRVLKEFPKITDKEWNWTWFELKRYFLMCGIMRSVPMYSSQVDAVWHEMLMFTREYEQFCTRFCGEMIHHAPHAPGASPQPGERALFDWVYGELFEQAPASGRVWGAFYRTQMPEQKLKELGELNPEELRVQWFNVKAAARYADLLASSNYLIERAKFQLAAASSGKPPYARDARHSSSGLGYDSVLGATGLLSGMLIYHSLSSPSDFTQQMDQAQSEEQRKANGSGDSTYACSGSSDDGRDHSGGSGGSDGGSGGDSSCGSGGGDSGGGGSSCGSSCGGGCSS
ncbi:hypothetical protein [Bacillus sp. FJAT-26390]|uniref:hypothetical protein n=1 Tax=Bacillus sp. FJAT-26390 TaxID=1743142 RepID=UPI000807CC42|nr:hypothetical protein [Bacillus sp. FJAT-26390]OBZ10008.1 hypothetical protein A7975_21795 [Bacillus sp. FJAT-26390]